MDLSFSRRAQRRSPAGAAATLEYRVLVATLDAMQVGSATARPMDGARFCRHTGQVSDPLVEILLGGPLWREAALAQGGSFNHAQAQALAGGKGA